MNSFRNEANEATNSFIWNGLKVTAVCLVIVGFVTGIWWGLRPVDAAVEHRVNVETHQYQEARKEAMIILEQEIARLDTEIVKAKDPKIRKALKGQRDVLVLRHARESVRLRK